MSNLKKSNSTRHFKQSIQIFSFSLGTSNAIFSSIQKSYLRLAQKMLFQISMNIEEWKAYFEEIASFISAHFYEINEEELKEMPIEILYQIISSGLWKSQTRIRFSHSSWKCTMKTVDTQFFSQKFSFIIRASGEVPYLHYIGKNSCLK